MKALLSSDHSRFLAMLVLLTTILMAMVAAWAIIIFGSVSTALAYLRGESLIVVHPTITLEIVQTNQTYNINFELANLTNKAIQIIGADVSCNCTTAQSLPVTILPASRMFFGFKYKPPSGSYNPVHARLFTSNPARPELQMTIVTRTQIATP